MKTAVLWAVALLLPLVPSAVEPTIERIGSVRHLEPQEAAKKLPVSITAQVTHLHPRQNGLFVFDGKQGVFVHLPDSPSVFEDLKPGSILRIKGVSNEGGFVPDVVATEVEVTGWKPLPKPRRLQPHEIDSPSITLDCEWVTVQGRLTGATVMKEYDHLTLDLEIQGTRIDVQVPYTEDGLNRAEELLFQRVEFPAVAGTVYNRHRQMTGRVFFVNSLDDFSPNREGEYWVDLDVRPIETLMRAGANYQKAVNTYGLVTYAGRNVVYLRGEKSCLKVATFGRLKLEPGDYVDVLGFIWVQPISPAFRARKVSIRKKKHPPAPVEIELGETLNPDWNYELVQTDVTLVDIGKSFGASTDPENTMSGTIESGHTSLLCHSDGLFFEARAPKGMLFGDQLKAGARLRLTGICNLTPNRDPRWQHFIGGIWLELRAADGITVLHPAPWWTPVRLLWASGLAIMVAVLFLVWIMLLRKTVASQTAVIGRQIERESILDERQRIARELHDTLEQILAGLALQLQNCLRQLDTGVEKGREALKLAQGMLRYARDESRASILDLRGGLLEKTDLPTALRESIGPLAEECGAQVSVEVQGVARRFKPFAERHLLRVAKEAVTNAVRHAKPSCITVCLQFGSGTLSLEIADDGGGFDVARLHKAERFGLLGMHERINRLHGTLSIDSVPGRGTTVCVRLSSTKEWELE